MTKVPSPSHGIRSGKILHFNQVISLGYLTTTDRLDIPRGPTDRFRRDDPTTSTTPPGIPRPSWWCISHWQPALSQL